MRFRPPTSACRLPRRIGVLLTTLALAGTGLPALTAAPAYAGTPADGAGFVDHGYGAATDDVTGHTSQSKAWFHDGSWWAVMMEPAETTPVAHENRWAIYRLDQASQVWVSTKVQVDQRNQAHPDVVASGNELYVVTSYSRSASAAVKVFKFNYQAAERTYALDPLFVDADPNPARPGRADDGVETPAQGVQYATIARSGGTLLIAYAASNEVWYMTSDAQALAWSAPQPLSTGDKAPFAGPPGATPSSDDIAVAVEHNGQLGIMWSRTSTPAAPYGGFYYAPWTGGGFGPIEVAWDGSMVGDNHISVKAASDGRLLVAVKTGYRTDADPLVAVLVRSAGGAWGERHPVVTGSVNGVKQDATRPILVLDTTKAHVLMTDRVNGGAVYRNSASLSGLSFPIGLGTAFIKSSAHPYVNDTTSTKQQVDAALGIVALASDDTDGTDTYLHGCTAGSTCTSGQAPPPAPKIPTTTTLASSPNPSVAGGPVTLTATVSGGPNIGGTVTFFNGDSQLKTVTLSGGSASTTTTTLSAGEHDLKAVYSGSEKYLTSQSAVLKHRVRAGTSGGTGGGSGGGTGGGSAGGGSGGIVTAPPVGSRLQVVAPSRRLAAGKKVGAGKLATVRLPAPAGLTGAALNVTVAAGKRATAVAVCPGTASKTACTRRPLMTLGKGARQARFTVLDLSGPGIKLYNRSGKARFTVDVQGWFVPDASKAKFTGLSPAQRVLKSKALGPQQAYTLRVPARLRPAGTTAVGLTVQAVRATRSGSIGVCRAGATKRACLARPALYGDPGGKATNVVIVPVGRDGKVQLANQAGSVRLTVFLNAVYLVS